MGYNKSILRGKFIPQQAYLKKQEQPQINNLTLHLMEQEKNNKVQLVNWWKSRWLLLSPTLRTKMENTKFGNNLPELSTTNYLKRRLITREMQKKPPKAW